MNSINQIRKRFSFDIVAVEIITLAGAAWMVWLCLNSTGTPVQDEIGHLLISKHAWSYPVWILDVWGRPVNTLVYMLPALLGLTAARFTSILIACLITIFTALAARRLGQKQLFWVVLFLWGQPWFTRLSFTAITEVPFSLFLILGIYLSLSKHERLAGFCFGLLPLIRHEGIALVGLWMVFGLIRKQWQAILSSVAPLVVYNFIYYLVFGKLAVEIFVNFKPNELYGQGSWFHFVQPTIESVGVVVVVLALIGLARFKALGWKWLAFFPFIAYFIIHTVIYRFGLFASGGYQMFILPIASGAAMAAGFGIEGLWVLLGKVLPNGWKKPSLALTIIMIGALLLPSVLSNQPYGQMPEERALQAAANWLNQNRPTPGKVISTHVWFHYYYGLRWEPGEYWIPKGTPIERLRIGDIVVWDAHYSNRWRVKLEDYQNPTNGWKKIADFENDLVIVFEKTR